jgi:hypothetical protein
LWLFEFDLEAAKVKSTTRKNADAITDYNNLSASVHAAKSANLSPFNTSTDVDHRKPI